MKLNRSTTGFSLPEMLLVLGVASIMLAITGSFALQALRAKERDDQLQTTVTTVLNAMEQKVGRHWVDTQCRTAPTDQSLPTLVSEGYLDSGFLDNDWSLALGYISWPDPPNVLSNISVTLTVENHELAQSTSLSLGLRDKLTVNGREVSVSRRIPSILSAQERLNYNPNTGCME